MLSCEVFSQPATNNIEIASRRTNMAAAYRGDTFRAMSRAASLAVVCGLAAPALASPRSDPTAGRAVFTGATMASETSIEVNPAAIGPGATTEIYAAAMAVIDQYAITRDHLDLTTGAVTPGAKIRDTEAGPGAMLAALWHVNERATLGFEARTAPAEVFIADQDPLGYHTLGGGQRTYVPLGVAASFRITNELYFGLSLGTATTTLHLHYARDTALERGHGPGGIDSDC